MLQLREMPSDADFDLTDPYNTPPRYNVLHDPHLKEYFQSPAMRKRLIEKGMHEIGELSLKDLQARLSGL